jgi:quinol monooxygenase YgiN
MAIAVIAPIPDKETYETLSEQMFGTKRGPTPDGCLVHSAGEGPNGFRVVDIWESQEAFDSFMNDKLTPAMQEAGMGDMMGAGTPPEIVELIQLSVNDEVRV